MKSLVITTPRLHMAPAPTDDPSIREIIGWLNNPLIVRFSEQRHRHHTVESQTAYIHALGEEDAYLAIYHEKTMIGTMTIHTDLHNLVANVGLMIGDSARWGLGFGYEAWKGACNKMLEGAFRKIEAGCMACNVSMMSICSHYGMSEEGRQEDHFLYHAIPIDLVHWGKVK